VGVSSPEVYGSVSENLHGKNMAFGKHRGVVTTPPLGSSRVKLRGFDLPVCWPSLRQIALQFRSRHHASMQASGPCCLGQSMNIIEDVRMKVDQINWRSCSPSVLFTIADVSLYSTARTAARVFVRRDSCRNVSNLFPIIRANRGRSVLSNKRRPM